MATIIAGGSLDQNPVGMIIIWNKLLPIPFGWQECNGSNGTPDFRDKFLKGVPNAGQDPGTLGGVDTVVLTIASMPSHVHGTVTNSHDHDWEITRADEAADVQARYQGAGDLPFFPDIVTEQVQVVDSVQFEGDDGAHNNIPQYNDSFYIMRLK
jgi:microcystin-dependent protein